MYEIVGQYTITRAQNDAFADLSGDYNPLHVDPVHARRLQFGRTVIHGIHHLLRTWDQATCQIPAPRRPTQLGASFQNPAFIDRPIQFNGHMSEQGTQLAVNARSDGKPILNLVLRFGLATPAATPTAADECPPREEPVDQDFPPSICEGRLPLLLDRTRTSELFPTLSQQLSAAVLAQIIATTRLVGMYSPGLHSIYSRIQLDLAAATDAPTDVLVWNTQSQDARVQLLRLGVQGAGLRGELDTFFRPRPVAQPSYAEALQRIALDDHWPQRALVIGGSRGVGEVTAKLLAAAGAEVLISYQYGLTDALRVAEEINTGGGNCTPLHLDVTADTLPNPRPFADKQAPTHIYYFASPHIDANRSPNWHDKTFACLNQVYVQAFHQIVQHYTTAAKYITFFYPSSIYIDQPESGFAEYAVAKAAGEALCTQLAARHRQAHFVVPRLPRMATDQTASIIRQHSKPALEVMYQELRKLA